jgi:hypothetical protein
MINTNQHNIIYIHRNTVHHNLHGNPNRRKPWNDFLIYQKITFIGSTNFPILQLQLEGGYDPLFIGSDMKEATTP